MNYLLNNQEEILSAPDGQDTRVCRFFFPGRELLGQGCWSQEGNLTLVIKEAIIPRRLPGCRMQRILQALREEQGKRQDTSANQEP